MPKPKNKFDISHLLNMLMYQRQVDDIFDSAAVEAARIGAAIDRYDPEHPFELKDYPLTRTRVEELLRQLQKSLELCIVNGVKSEWTLANNKNDELSRRVFGDNVGKLSQAQYRRYFSNNEDARDAFLQRKEQGLNLSDRVWKYTDTFKSEIELGLDLGLKGGLSAHEMAKELQQYLQHPDMLFRRVRDERGILHLSKNAAQFHPGQGVYRSSYQNARRLAATETNIAYRTSDHTRWQQMDFVVGIEIHLSGNHTCKGRDGKPHEFHDICDELAGKYPKDFKFTGWHPNCRCYATSILKTDEEIDADTEKVMRGEKMDGESVNKVTDVPQGFKDWLERNQERAQRSLSVPYFIRDNAKYLPEGYQDLYASKMPYESVKELAEAMRYNKAHAQFPPEIVANNKELSRVLPVIQGKIMNFSEADGEKGNPDYHLTDGEEKGFHHNCQTCTLAYELRRRGFDVEAMPNPLQKGRKRLREMDKFYDKEANWTERFLNLDGTKTDYAWSTGAHLTDTPESKRAFIYGKTAEAGRYEVYCGWKGGSAHVFIVERTADGDLIWYDPQSGKKGKPIAGYASSMNPKNIGVLRIDNKLINPKYAKRMLKARK